MYPSPDNLAQSEQEFFPSSTEGQTQKTKNS